MQLQPKRPPGRNDRKAAVYASEIVRLRSAGYTYEAIREALAEIGIKLSTSALRREVRRFRSRSPSLTGTPGSRAAAPTPATAVPSGTPALPAKPLVPPGTSGASGREVAEAFFNAHPSNPLLHSRETP